MMSRLLERIHQYFYIPPKALFEISKKNIKIGTICVYILLVFGLSFLYIQYAIIDSTDIIRLSYYAGITLLCLLFLTCSHFAKKKDGYRTNEGLLILLCSTICLMMYYNVFFGSTPFDVINFYFAIVVMILILELPPLFYTLAIVIFFFETMYIDTIRPMFGVVFHLNNAIFGFVLIIFSFSKRKLVSEREKNRAEIENRNRMLSVQNIELARQKDSLLMRKQYLEDAVDTQSQALELQKERIIRLQDNTIMSLSNLVENRDEDTGNHVLRTRDYVQLIATEAYLTGSFPELNEHTITLYIKAAPMHDIGKVIVPDKVLKKPGKLTPEEFDLIKLHTVKGGKIVHEVLGNGEDMEYVSIAREIAVSHHEKYDGSGYPYGLKGKGIPLSARIMAVADVFDALVSPRCYKEPMPLEKAFSIIEEGAGKHFDPVLANLFLNKKEEVIAIMNKYQV